MEINMETAEKIVTEVLPVMCRKRSAKFGWAPNAREKLSRARTASAALADSCYWNKQLLGSADNRWPVLAGKRTAMVLNICPRRFYSTFSSFEEVVVLQFLPVKLINAWVKLCRDVCVSDQTNQNITKELCSFRYSVNITI